MEPEKYIGAFEPGTNPFEVTIVRLIDPKAVDFGAINQPFLMKLLTRIKMRSDTPETKEAFDYLVKGIEVRQTFCDIFTPEVSEIYYDGDVMIVDLTSYLKPGTEEKIKRLNRVAERSPIVHRPDRLPKQEVEDRAITNLFMRRLEEEHDMDEALRLAMVRDELQNEMERIVVEFEKEKESSEADTAEGTGEADTAEGTGEADTAEGTGEAAEEDPAEEGTPQNEEGEDEDGDVEPDRSSAEEALEERLNSKLSRMEEMAEKGETAPDAGEVGTDGGAPEGGIGDLMSRLRSLKMGEGEDTDQVPGSTEEEEPEEEGQGEEGVETPETTDGTAPSDVGEDRDTGGEGAKIEGDKENKLNEIMQKLKSGPLSDVVEEKEEAPDAERAEGTDEELPPGPPETVEKPKKKVKRKRKVKK